MNFFGGEFLEPSRVPLILKLERIELIAGTSQPLCKLGGFVVGAVEFGLPLANVGFGGFDDTAFFRDMLARAVERVTGI